MNDNQEGDENLNSNSGEAENTHMDVAQENNTLHNDEMFTFPSPRMATIIAEFKGLEEASSAKAWIKQLVSTAALRK